jgi:hypothetical protein
LIGADEATGLVYAFGPRGKAQLVARSGISVGQDIGVESVGFVPPAFGRRGRAYLADLGALGSPTTGSDSVLSLAGGGLVSAGVRPGDLIVAAEASGVTITVRCRRSCTVRRLGKALDATHAEGHIAFSR